MIKISEMPTLAEVKARIHENHQRIVARIARRKRVKRIHQMYHARRR